MDGDIDNICEVILDYIQFCQGLCIPTKEVKRYNNDKPWFDKSIRSKLIARSKAFQSGDSTAYKNAMYDVKRPSNWPKGLIQNH